MCNKKKDKKQWHYSYMKHLEIIAFLKFHIGNKQNNTLQFIFFNNYYCTCLIFLLP
jgi:hypothetical protein